MATWLDVRPENIPDALRHGTRFVLWRADTSRSVKASKVPYQVHHPLRKASTADPKTWADFDDALNVYSKLVRQRRDPTRGPVAGIGIVLTPDFNVTCLDLDHVVEHGIVNPHAQQIIERCGYSWTEYSPSGTGLHTWVFGRVPRALKGEGFEVYSDSRYIALTGHRLADTLPYLTHAQDYLDLVTRVVLPTATPRPDYRGPSTPPPDDLLGALLAVLQRWGLDVEYTRPWSTGYLARLHECPWADEHASGLRDGASIQIHASGATSFTCHHTACWRRDWATLRQRMETAR